MAGSFWENKTAHSGTQVIADQLGDGRVRLSTYDGALHNHLLSPFDRHCLSINLKIEGDTIKQFTQMEWKYKVISALFLMLHGDSLS